MGVYDVRDTFLGVLIIRGDPTLRGSIFGVSSSRQPPYLGPARAHRKGRLGGLGLRTYRD